MTGDLPTVAVLGTGIMGGPMARRIIEAGHPLRAWNRSRYKVEPLVQLGAVAAETPAEACDGADVVITMLADGPATERVMVGARGALESMQREAVWLQMGTIGMDATEQLAEAAAARPVTFVDAPVLGTRKPAETGELVVLASGPAEAEERCASVLDAVSSRVLWMEGPPGQAARLKLAVNTWVLGLVSVLAETLALARSLGVDPGLFLETIRGSALDAGYAHIKGQAMLDEKFPVSFPLHLAIKDAELLLQAAQAAGVKLPVAETVRAQLQRALELQQGEEDFAAVFRAVQGE